MSEDPTLDKKELHVSKLSSRLLDAEWELSCLAFPDISPLLRQRANDSAWSVTIR